MGSKGPLEMVTPENWRKRTSLTFSKRSDSTLAVDTAYEAYYKLRSEANGKALLAALEAYLKEKGGFWEKCERDKASGGLMRYIYYKVRQSYGANVGNAALRALRDVDIPHSRFGVLYLFANTEIEIDFVAQGLSGVAKVGGTFAQGFAGNYSVDIAGESVKSSQIIEGGGAVLNLSASLVRVKRNLKEHSGGVQKIGPRAVTPKAQAPFEWPRGTKELWKDDASTASILWAYTRDGADLLRLKITNLVRELVEWARLKLMGKAKTIAQISGAMVAQVVKVVTGQILKEAAPFIGAGIDIGAGIAKTISAAKTRVESWLDRRRIVLQPGHPELLAQSIESEMEQGIGLGLFAMLKGVAKMAVQTLLPGAGNLVNAIVGGVEFVVRFLWRLYENSKIQKFLEKAKELFEREKGLATLTQDTESGRMRLMPNLDRSSGSIIHSLSRFKTFYEEGCDASPCIPMLTLNSGICGSLMTMLRMFDDTSTHERISQETHDAGERYFTRLKQFGRGYLTATGFRFHSKNHSVYRLLNHALQDHQTAGLSKTDKVLNFVGGV